METFVWDRCYITGLKAVDEQHRHLVDLINQFGDSLRTGQSENDAYLQATFDELFAYALHHFGDEEKLMVEAAVDPAHADLHRLHHRQFSEQLSSMWASRTLMSQPAETLHGFLTSWLGFHILGEDQTMARQIAAIQSGDTPSRAFESAVIPTENGIAALIKALRTLYELLCRQNADLAAANLRLEKRVTERTDELARINQQLIDANASLQQTSRIDGLLGIANRRCFDEKLEQEWRRAARDQRPLALLMIDVDHFKLYNDTYGHQAGDACLQAIAKAISSELRRAADLLARYGGEELAAIMPNMDPTSAKMVALEISETIVELNIPHSASPTANHVTVTIGVASVVPERGSHAGDLIAAADRALYSGKQSGRDQVSLG